MWIGVVNTLNIVHMEKFSIELFGIVLRIVLSVVSDKYKYIFILSLNHL